MSYQQLRAFLWFGGILNAYLAISNIVAAYTERDALALVLSLVNTACVLLSARSAQRLDDTVKSPKNSQN